VQAITISPPIYKLSALKRLNICYSKYFEQGRKVS